MKYLVPKRMGDTAVSFPYDERTIARAVWAATYGIGCAYDVACEAMAAEPEVSDDKLAAGYIRLLLVDPEAAMALGQRRAKQMNKANTKEIIPKKIFADAHASTMKLRAFKVRGGGREEALGMIFQPANIMPPPRPHVFKGGASYTSVSFDPPRGWRTPAGVFICVSTCDTRPEPGGNPWFHKFSMEAWLAMEAYNLESVNVVVIFTGENPTVRVVRFSGESSCPSCQLVLSRFASDLAELNVAESCGRVTCKRCCDAAYCADIEDASSGRPGATVQEIE